MHTITLCAYTYICFGNARGVMVSFIGNGHSDTSSNPGRG